MHKNGWLHNNAKNIPHKTLNKEERKTSPNANIFYKPRNLKFKSSTLSVSIFTFLFRRHGATVGGGGVFPFVIHK